MKTHRTWTTNMLAFALVFVIFTGCIGQIPEDEKTQWYTIATPIAENILSSLNDNNYQGFVRDFSEETKNATTPEDFVELREFLTSTIGKYISSTPTEVTEEEGYIVVYFTAKFEQEENVTVRVVFKEGDNTHEVYGLWFDSPKLRG